MNPQTQAAGDDAVVEPSFPSAEELYDVLMQDIEPELMRSNLPKLDESYISESEQERASRYKKYSQAFVEFQQKMDSYMSEKNKNLQDYYHQQMLQIEQKSRDKDKQLLTELEANFL